MVEHFLYPEVLKIVSKQRVAQIVNLRKIYLLEMEGQFFLMNHFWIL